MQPLGNVSDLDHGHAVMLYACLAHVNGLDRNPVISGEIAQLAAQAARRQLGEAL